MPPMRAATLLVVAVALAAPLRAQQWQGGVSIDLVRRAAERRSVRDADSLVAAWQASAHGVLRYASIIDHGNGPIERVIRADELQVEVYGEGANRSKQIIRAWRDTSYLPNRISYHRDHLGIVANDFGATIRLGQGDEVRDVVHPLSAIGLSQYEFAVGDTVTITAAQRRTRVVAVQVRPRNADSAAAVGTLYLDVDRAELVRFSFTFTPAAYRDPTVKAITVMLENGLQQRTQWLPWRQSIVIERAEPLFDLSIRTVIRADWTIDEYILGVTPPANRFSGAFIDGPRRPFPGGTWPGPIAGVVRALPATDADVAAVTEEASASLNGRFLSGLPRLRIFGAGLSEFLAINRVSGITPGFGASLALGARTKVTGHVAYGLSDSRVTARGEVVHMLGPVALGAFAAHQLEQTGDLAALSPLENSIATLIAGRDYGEYALVSRTGVSIRHDAAIGWRFSAATVSVASVAAQFHPISGDGRDNPALGAPAEAVAGVAMTLHGQVGTQWQVDLEAGSTGWARLHAGASGVASVGRSALQWRLVGGTATSDLPAYRSFVVGGLNTLPGVPLHSVGGRRLAFGDIALAIPIRVPTPPFPYSQYIHLPSTIGPFVAAGIAGGTIAGVPWVGDGVPRPVVGLRLDLWGPLLRFEEGVSLRTGKTLFSIGIHPDWWALM